MQRRASWIWRDRGASPGAAGIDPRADRNLFVLFRRPFRLEHSPETAPARISADGRYKLYVNGSYVGRGPARCDPLFQYYDTHDLAPFLRTGDNVITVLVHSYGSDMSWYELSRADWARTLGCGGLFLECAASSPSDDGQPLLLDSDRSWRYLVCDAWEADAPSGAVGFVEVFDARNEPVGWHGPTFDDSTWSHAVVLRASGLGFAPDVEPFPHMVARDIPPMLEELRDAVRVLEPREIAVGDDADMLSLAETRDISPLSACSVEHLSAMLTAQRDATQITLAPNRAVTIVIDFGRNVTGYPRLELDAPAGATVDVSYAEQLRDDARVPVQRANPITSQNVHRYITRDGEQAWEKFERAGFRYLQLTFASPSAAGARLAVRRANLNFASYPVDRRGAFACSDDLLNRLWRAGADTLQLCMHDGFEDCPTREQRQWVGDAYIESLVNFAAFGDPRLTAKLIRQVAQSQMRDGMTQMATPSDMSARWPLFIVDFCLYWLMTIGEYVLHTGDRRIVDDVFPSVVRAIGWFEAQIGELGLIVEPPGWIFIDWAQVDRRGACTALNALFVRALQDASALADQQGARTHTRRWRALARRVSVALNERLWDEDRGVYVDALLCDGAGSASVSRRVSQHANAAMIAASIAPRRRWKRMLDYVMDERRLVATNTNLVSAPEGLDEEREVVLAQPFFAHHLHRALAAAGRHGDMLENIRTRWAPMLDEKGTGTLWEHWHGEASRCHAWSATPTYDLSREILGVQPISPGFERFRIAPQVANLTWADGVYPSVVGDIPVSWHRDGHRFSLKFECPAGAEAQFVVPPAASHVTVNGKSADISTKRGEPQVINGLTQGSWMIEATLRDDTSARRRSASI